MLPRRTRSAFTLVELLVVIAIVGILISLLMPILGSAREETYAAICATQFNQIFNASFVYTTKNNDHMPYFGSLAGRPDPVHWWVTQIAEDIQDQLDILACPTDDEPHRRVSVTRIAQFDFGNISNNYHGFGYKKRLQQYRRYQKEPTERTRLPLRIAERSTATGAWTLDMSYRGSCDTVEEVQVPTGSYAQGSFTLTETVKQARKLTDWGKPAKTIMLVEGQTPRNWHPGCPPANVAAFAPSECFRYSEDLEPLQYSLELPMMKRTYGPSWIRHHGTDNYLFMDGHVERLLPHQAGEIGKDWQKNLAYYSAGH